MKGRAIFRLPYEETYTLIEGETETLMSFACLNKRTGFVVAPFSTIEENPIIVIHPEKVVTDSISASLSVKGIGHEGGFSQKMTSNNLTYAIDFANFHAQLKAGVFSKIVLSRCVKEPADSHLSPIALFQKACELYPRLFVALVSTPQSGTWLTASPEILLQSEPANSWRTIALAGTMKLEGRQLTFDNPAQDIELAWTTKNIKEQRIVATYITECLEQYAIDIREEGTRTVRAGNLVHLRTDFTFTLPDRDHLGNLISTLHPTPAVCGMPKEAASRFIISNETTPRRYYSGFMGPLEIASPTAPDTHLYVSLRCMNITADGYYLYAGGGLLPDSCEQQEWAETEAKLETMRELLRRSAMQQQCCYTK